MTAAHPGVVDVVLQLGRTSAIDSHFDNINSPVGALTFGALEHGGVTVVFDDATTVERAADQIRHLQAAFDDAARRRQEQQAWAEYERARAAHPSARPGPLQLVRP